jgi:tellurite resistance-related uncharacterized protein
VDGIEDYDDPTPWLGGVVLSTSERTQLVHVLRLLDPSLDETAILGGSFETFEGANGVAEVPLEWWDVEDASGTVRYQLWLYCADGGQLFDAGTTTSVAYIAQSVFWTKEAAPADLGEQLARAQRAMKNLADSDLAGVAFVHR